jgi:hypothetical protein
MLLQDGKDKIINLYFFKLVVTSTVQKYKNKLKLEARMLLNMLKFRHKVLKV